MGTYISSIYRILIYIFRVLKTSESSNPFNFHHLTSKHQYSLYIDISYRQSSSSSSSTTTATINSGSSSSTAKEDSSHRQILILRNELLFERYLRQQYRRRVGLLQRDTISLETDQNEKQILVLSSLSLSSILIYLSLE